MPPRVIVGDLAQALLDAHGDTIAAESRVVDLLYDLLPGWRLLWPTARSWVWRPPTTIDVYGAIDSPAAAAALHLAGFVGGVTLHDHGPEAFLTCTCTTRTP